ncbi:hypothetical protein E4T63_20850 [Pseudomonas fluorescens]|uniref:Uncharacterized protein n=1 Tax=Pseudomonas fluorescens TaxID=294 RepID=A0AAP9CK29_PSEFL|nr:hypothetical protein E4T63_20850 [Pseudomonas fluorescens]
MLARNRSCRRSIVGAGLLAKAVVQAAMMLTDRPFSRASPLPQGDRASLQVAKHDLIWCITAAIT